MYVKYWLRVIKLVVYIGLQKNVAALISRIFIGIKHFAPIANVKCHDILCFIGFYVGNGAKIYEMTGYQLQNYLLSSSCCKLGYMSNSNGTFKGIKKKMELSRIPHHFTHSSVNINGSYNIYAL